MEKLYRSLLVVSLISYLLYIFLPDTNLQPLNEDEHKVLAWAGYGALIHWPNWLFWLFVLVWFPITFGMWFYNSLARKLFFLLSLLFVFLNPFDGLYISTGLEMMFGQLTASLDGAILAISYLTSISHRFGHA